MRDGQLAVVIDRDGGVIHAVHLATDDERAYEVAMEILAYEAGAWTGDTDVQMLKIRAVFPTFDALVQPVVAGIVLSDDEARLRDAVGEIVWCGYETPQGIPSRQLDDQDSDDADAEAADDRDARHAQNLRERSERA